MTIDPVISKIEEASSFKELASITNNLVLYIDDPDEGSDYLIDREYLEIRKELKRVE